ncbi:VOC family protein [Streptomyces sp. ISL-11]|uniref:VOC family protein n=1 Tax=Streptomyces sp. ISL-11 TaxID=2819174 RepID=UPI001BE5D30F|nr:VOC family protein [Streptomyces sp. ISL-11]MBT2383813.1 VOC family protein [Streptomyces sp. ISL-11]
MPARLDHTIVHSTDRFASARFLTGLLAAPEPKPFGPFAAVPLEGGVTIDYAEHVVDPGSIVLQHLAFRVNDEEFEAVRARIAERGMPFWGAPGHGQPQQVGRRPDGRSVYVDDPDGHAIEFLTREL